jgi:hemerythrin-like domain-containing protein
MQARGPLMIEHRLIERMIKLIKKILGKTESDHKVNPVFVERVIDFIRMYADRTHHGKEEDILFKELSKRTLTDHDKKIMDELIEEHVMSRQITRHLIAANARYKNGDTSALEDILNKLGLLVELYPKHIEKEDTIFFPASRSYFTEEEDQAILSEFWEFDRKMIHEKYTSLIASLEGE